MFPPLVPTLDLDLHFVLCDFGALGTAYVETVPTEVDRDTIKSQLGGVLAEAR